MPDHITASILTPTTKTPIVFPSAFTGTDTWIKIVSVLLSNSGLPKKTYLSVLTDNEYDLILDLNFNRTNFTSMVLLNFPQAIRIGKGNHLGQPFYNLEIKTKYLRDERNMYRSLIETLACLTDKPVDFNRAGSSR